MNRIKGVVHMHLRNRSTWLMTPWLILLLSFITNFTIMFFAKDHIVIYTGGVAAIYLYMFIIGIVNSHDTFPFALGFNMRRTDYFLGTALTGISVNGVFAIMLLLLSIVEHDLTGGWGVNLHFFHLPYLNDGPLIGQLWVYFVILVHVYFLGLAMFSMYQRFGQIGMYTFFILVAMFCGVSIYTLTYYNWWGSFFAPLAQLSAIELASWGALLMACYALVSYMLLRRAIVR